VTGRDGVDLRVQVVVGAAVQTQTIAFIGTWTMGNCGREETTRAENWEENFRALSLFVDVLACKLYEQQVK